MKTDVTKNYLLKAEHDLGTAELTYSSRPEYTDTVTFHSQQAVEKALKAYLNFHKEKINTKHFRKRLESILPNIFKDCEMTNGDILDEFADNGMRFSRKRGI